jgi:NodT family efflux transporter outer membrane factor (OMF) lipoprotein
VSCLAVLVAAGCAVGPDYRAPEIPLPAGWSVPAAPRAGTDGTPLERWWTVFRDPILESLIDRALAGNLDLKIAETRVRQARAARGIVASAGVPRIDAEAAAARTGRSEAVPPFRDASDEESPFGTREQNVFEAGFDASWEIDLFGGVRRDKEAALAQVQAAEEARRDVMVSLLAELARNYVELRATQRRIRILDANLGSQRETLALAVARHEAGLGTELDVSRAEGLLETTASRRPILERIASEAIHRLGVLLGGDPGSLQTELEPAFAIPEAPPDVPSTLPSELLSRRPDLRRAERELAAATAGIGVARADLFPRFSILGDFGRRSEEIADLSSGRSRFWSFVPRLRWPLLSGGRIRANIRLQDARHEEALRQYERAILIALEEVENALSAHAFEARRQESLRGSVVATRRALEIATERYAGGLESFLSVLDAQRSLYDVEDQLVQGERNRALSLIAVYKSLGGGWSPDASPDQMIRSAESLRK